MDRADAELSTGIPAFDRVLSGLLPGDNLVWEVESIDDYISFVRPFVARALRQGRSVTYFRFAKHQPVVDPDPEITVVELDPQDGFEAFLDGVHLAIERAGEGAFHIFDSLSELAADWYCDRMLGNFFQLTCPYLHVLGTLAYFVLTRGYHSSFATEPISETTQLLLAVYHHDKKLYVQPLKVEGRFLPQMYTLHHLDGDSVEPVTESHTVSQILTSSPRASMGLLRHHLGVWTRTFVQAGDLWEQYQGGQAPRQPVDDMFRQLLRMAISRHERVLDLAERYFDLGDMLDVGRRLLGTGLIGGKSAGMLLARAILRRSDPKWNDLLEVHDSFYIPSDVFYTFLVRNGCWEIRKRQRRATLAGVRDGYLTGVHEARQRILKGTFPEYMIRRLSEMLDYFGQSPIIVRSSSLLEDNFGNAFAGKYDSVFCANQGSHEERLRGLMAAVKTVYASTLSKPALTYRARFGLLDRDEQMALLIQRVSGARHGPYYHPHLAGVGFSFNPYVWNEDIDPRAGMLRLVFGLGTRAVDRTDDDYTRLVALNAPRQRPEGNSEDVRRYMQRRIDVLDLENNRLATGSFEEIVDKGGNIPVDLFASHDRRLERESRQQGRTLSHRVLDFDRLLTETDFVDDMRDMLRTLEEAYENPVDVEFTVNFLDEKRYRINVVQCRPLQVKGSTVVLAPPEDLAPDVLVLSSNGPIIGQSRIEDIDRFVYVVPSVYAELPLNERYSVARTIGAVLRVGKEQDWERVMLLGPGRWGTTTPSLGVPVSFAEISSVTVLCEIVAMREDLAPDASMGTHFFSELVEMDMLYLAVVPDGEDGSLNTGFFEEGENQLTQLLPEAGPYAHVIRVIDPLDASPSGRVRLYADTLKQRMVCYTDVSDG